MAIQGILHIDSHGTLKFKSFVQVTSLTSPTALHLPVGSATAQQNMQNDKSSTPWQLQVSQGNAKIVKPFLRTIAN